MTIALVSPLSDRRTDIPVVSSDTQSGGVSFADSLKNAIASTASVIQSTDSTAVSGITGGAPVNDVVNSILEAERALHLSLAVRDKAVSAFQELSRMQI